MGEVALNPDMFREVLADIYQRVTRAGADPRTVADALESVRDGLGKAERPFPVWDLIDRHIGEAWGRPEQAALITLRQRFLAEVFHTETARIKEAIRVDAEKGWRRLLCGYAEASGLWRLELCQSLVEEDYPIAPSHEEGLAQLREHLQFTLQGCWFNAYPLYVQLANNPLIAVPDQARLCVIAGEIALCNVDRPGTDREHFSRALELMPNTSYALVGMAKYFLQQGDLPNTRSRLQQALALDPVSGAACCRMGETYEREGSMEVAAEWYQEAIRRQPGDPDGYVGLCGLYGKGYAIAGDEDPIPEFTERAKTVSPLREAYFCRVAALAYQQREQRDPAHTWLQRAITVSPANPQAYVADGYLYLDQKDYANAQDRFDQAIQVAPYAFDGYLGRARLAEDQSDWGPAARFYQRAGEHPCGFASLCKAKSAQMMWEQGRTEEARIEIFRVLQTGPYSEQVLEIAEWMGEEDYWKHKDLKEAQRWFAQIRNVVGETYETRYHLHLRTLAEADAEYQAARDAY